MEAPPLICEARRTVHRRPVHSSRRAAIACGRAALASVALGLAMACLAAAPAPALAAPTSCDKLAAPGGSEGGNGSPEAPFATAQQLADALAPGEVGCLRAGTYGGGLSVGHGGSPDAPIVLRSYPGEQATITGRVYIEQGSDYVTIADLELDGNYQADGSEPLPSPTVNADDTTFEGDDVTNENTAICFDLGNSSWGAAGSTVIVEDHIHNCGVLPATNQDHGIYVADATNTHIVDNLIDHNADRGIQLFPSSTGAVITGNVISENGEGIIFSGEDGVASDDNVVEHNLIVNSLVRHDIESWYPAGNPLGAGNVAQHNCVSADGVETDGGGFTAQDNVTVSPGELVLDRERRLRRARPARRAPHRWPGSPVRCSPPSHARHPPAPKHARAQRAPRPRKPRARACARSAARARQALPQGEPAQRKDRRRDLQPEAQPVVDAVDADARPAQRIARMQDARAAPPRPCSRRAPSPPRRARPRRRRGRPATCTRCPGAPRRRPWSARAHRPARHRRAA